MKLKLAFATIISLIFSLSAYATEYTASFKNSSPEQAVEILRKATGYDFVYQKSILDQNKNKVTGEYKNLKLEDLLENTIVTQLDLSYRIIGNTVTINAAAIDKLSPKKEVKVHGVVVDKEGDPLVGATVQIKGTTMGVITDIDGNFSVHAPIGSILQISYIGMHPQDIQVKDDGALNVVLEPNSQMLSEVVVTGYQELTKEKLTGAVSTISADKLEERYTTNLVDNLEGKVAGLSTYGGNMVIRGVGTLNNSSTPLLVVDGVPIEGSINDLNPQNIESVNVLKDAAAAAIYGARAANGIIVVTTKNAKKKGKVDIDFSLNMTLYENRNMDYHDNFYMDAGEHIKAESEYYEYAFFEEDEDNDPAMNIKQFEQNLPKGQGEISPIMYAYYQLAKGEISRDQLDSQLVALSKNNYARDYADAMYRRRLLQQYNLAVRTQSDIASNNIVVNYKHDNVGIIGHKYDWLNISYKGIIEISKWLQASVSINSLYSNQVAYGYDYFGNTYSNPFAYAPYEPFYNKDGSIRRLYGSYCGNQFYTVPEGMHDLSVNPVDEMFDNTQTDRHSNMRYHGSLLFRIIDGLSANAQFIYETKELNSQHYANEDSHASRMMRNAYTYKKSDGTIGYYTPEDGGFLQTTVTSGNYWTARGQIDFNKTFGKHSIQALAGLEFRETMSKGTKSLVLGFVDQLQSSATHTVDFGMLSQMNTSPYFMKEQGGFSARQFVFAPYLSGGMGIIMETHHRYGSGYANATYTYDNKYNIFGSFRKDYADVFGLNSKFRGKPLWSVGAGWNMHNEEFMHDINWINFLKLRFSYGITGNIYQGATSYMTASTGSINESTNLPYGVVTSPANPNLRWEQNKTTNVGVDFGMFDYRFHGSLDYYNKIGIDIFNGTNLDPTTGFTSIVANAASIVNRGFEAVLSYDWFRADARTDFAWSTSLTFTYNKNKVTKVENDATSAYQLVSTPYKVGYPVSALWSYRFAGIGDIEGQEGANLFYGDDDALETNPSSQSPDVLEYSGQSDPKYMAGLDNTMRWNGFQFSFVLAYYGGHKMRALPHNNGFSSFSGTIPSYFVNAWTPENKTDIPGYGRWASRAGYSTEANYANNAIHDASFLKLRNIVLGYTFPDKWLRVIGVNGLSFRFQINELPALWKANKVGVDPETLGIRGRSSYTFGVNFNI